MGKPQKPKPPPNFPPDGLPARAPAGRGRVHDIPAEELDEIGRSLLRQLDTDSVVFLAARDDGAAKIYAVTLDPDSPSGRLVRDVQRALADGRLLRSLGLVNGSELLSHEQRENERD